MQAYMNEREVQIVDGEGCPTVYVYTVYFTRNVQKERDVQKSRAPFFQTTFHTTSGYAERAH